MIDPLPVLGDRTLLRRFTLDDLPAFQAYRHDEEVARYQGWMPQDDVEAAEFLTRMSDSPTFPLGDWIQLAIAERQSGVLIGDIGLCIGDEAAEIGFTLGAEWQRRGLATEAVGLAIRLVFDSTLVDRIMAITDARNSPSIRLLERLSMSRVSTQEALFRGGECIEHAYAVIRRDWIVRE